MIVREVMTTDLITVAPDDTLSHAANLLRQHQFHHLSVVRVAKAPQTGKTGYRAPHGPLLLEGLLTSNDIDLAVELERQSSAHTPMERPWQEERVLNQQEREEQSDLALRYGFGEEDTPALSLPPTDSPSLRHAGLCGT